MNVKSRSQLSPHQGNLFRHRFFLKQWVVVISLLMAFLLIPSCGLLGTAVGLGITKLKFGCLPEGSLIDTAKGPVPIESLASGDRIVGFDGGTVVINQIHQYREDPATSRYLTFHFASGGTLSTSPRHRIDGVPAYRIRVGDTCGSSKVVSIQFLHGVSRSFDLLTDDSGYRIAGIPVNSMIREMAGSEKSENRPVSIR